MKYISLLILLVSFGLFAQQKPQKDLKVGLVLSGGGAKGLAHIGALKVIQDAGIRVDYIAGTSMGAIVGSLFAAGYTPHQLDSIFQETNFDPLIQDELPRASKTFYEKKEAQRYALTLPFNNFKLSFPSGLSKGQNIYNLISQLTVNVSDINDFSKLPIPFFCVGTNIETGKEVILDHGSLPQDVSASGAIPTLFSPVLINGKLITDGGVSNNYPVEELKKRGVDYIIGVDVQDSLVGRKKLQTAFEILTQVNNFRTIKAMAKKRKLTDLYIKPDIKDFSILSFDKGKRIIKKGEEAAEMHVKQLRKIAAMQHHDAAWTHQRKGVKLNDSLFIEGIKISGNSNYPRSYIRGKLRIETHHKTSYKKLNNGINNLSATGNFKRVQYRLIPRKSGGNDLNVIVEENKNNTSLRVAVHYDELYKIGALLNITQKSLLFENDITSLDIVAGDNFRYDFNYYIDKGNYWSIGLHSKIDQFNKNVSFDFVKNNSNIGDYNVNKVDLSYFDFTNQLYAETFLLKQFKFGLGLEHKYTKFETQTIIEEDTNQEIPINILEQSNLYSAYGYLEYDTYNNAYFPTHGFHFEGNFHTYLLSSDASYDFSKFSIAKGSFGYAFSPLPKLAVRLQTETGFRIGNNGMNTLNFFLGGYGNHYVNNVTPFYGYDYLSLSGDSYVKSLAEVDYEIFKKNHVIAGYNIANVEDGLYKTGNFLSIPDYSGLELGYGLETFIGPVEVKYSYSPETTRSNWFFSVGFWF